jgi:hypothetical protein
MGLIARGYRTTLQFLLLLLLFFPFNEFILYIIYSFLISFRRNRRLYFANSSRVSDALGIFGMRDLIESEGSIETGVLEDNFLASRMFD